ncbi:hypothetical protein [Luteibacter sp. 3190]|uniref:hypothetical protein n=1 Tax=Luteibacter sp. 3190 TaxID=2817736 RepID=UPI00286540F2|nr:hypothetical protein [Luteibacter sp. 3190]MDR6935682.1 hypothetical protein [Luteibacter sp. 3190]
MKNVFVACAFAAVAFSVQAGDALRNVDAAQATSFAPICPPGEVAVAHYINGKLTWVCEPEPTR